MKIIKEDLIELSKKGNFTMIAHGCNCYCIQKSGIAKLMNENFDTSNILKYRLEQERYKGDINKLGNIEISDSYIDNKDFIGYIKVVNCYTQYNLGKDADLASVILCFRKLADYLKQKNGKLGIPAIGCGIGGLDFKMFLKVCKTYFKDLDVTLVLLEKDYNNWEEIINKQ